MVLLMRIHAQREKVLAAFTREVLAGYPEGGAGFTRSADRFANPVGATLAESGAALLDAAVAGSPEADVVAALDPMVRLRAVQDLRPADAVGFVFGLKRAVEKVLGPDLPAEEHRVFAERVDRMVLLACEAYVKCREQVFALSARMMRDRAFKLMERAGALAGPAGDDAGGEGNVTA